MQCSIFNLDNEQDGMDQNGNNEKLVVAGRPVDRYKQFVIKRVNERHFMFGIFLLQKKHTCLANSRVAKFKESPKEEPPRILFLCGHMSLQSVQEIRGNQRLN